METTDGVTKKVKNFTFYNDNTLIARSSPGVPTSSQVLGSVSKSTEEDNIISYRVQKGDTLKSIAEEHNVSKDTIRWANSLNNGNISPGDELLILPTTGVLYYVKRYDTPSEIAQMHDADLEKIIAYNDIEDATQIKPGDQLIIPDGQKPAGPVYREAPNTSYASFDAVTYGTVTQEDHPSHARSIDIANNCGTPIYSGGSGTVRSAGYDRDKAGNFVKIDHGNFVALYAHLQARYVNSGQRVKSGEQIGTMGNTGYTIGPTGCHIHFETMMGRNPFGNMQRGETMR